MSKTFLSSLLFIITLGLGAQSINDPGVHLVLNYTTGEIDAMHIKLENTHAENKLLSINSNNATDATTHWENGSWRSGYYNTYVPGGYGGWYNPDEHNRHWSNHPLLRESARYSLGYIHGARNWSGTSIYNTRALNGIDYITNQQQADGSYLWWRQRPGLNTPDTDSSDPNSLNTYHFFTLGYALKALSEGYWYKKCVASQTATDQYDAIVDAADFVSGKIQAELLNVNSNSNIKGLTAWGLAAAHKATGDTQYKDDAILLADAIIADQDPATGLWLTGAEEDIKAWPENPTDLDQWIAGDFDGDGEEEVLQKYGTDAIYYYNRDAHEKAGQLRDVIMLGQDNRYTGISDLERWVVGNFDDDPEDEVLHKFQGNPKIYLWNHGDSSLGANAVYSGTAHIEKWLVGNFDNDDKDEVLQKYVGSDKLYLWNGPHSFGANRIHTFDNTLEDWIVGNFDGDNKQEVLWKYAETTNVYLWNAGSNFQSNSVYSGSHVEDWLAGDFDGDSVDEVLQKYTGSPTIYLWDGSYNFKENPVYSGNSHITKWIAGDFDGDGNEEVLQKYSGAKVYLWNYGGNFNGSAPYDGSAHTINWLVADTEGNGEDELFQVFDNSSAIYYWEDSENCMGCYKVYNIPAYKYYHDTRIQYHFFTLGALIETYSLLSGTKKATYAGAIKKAVNSVISRLHHIDTDRMSNFYIDINNNLIPKFLRDRESYNSREAIQQLAQLAYYAESDLANFTTTDIDRIVSLANRMVHADYPGYAYYKDYMNAINNNTYLDFYGGCAYNTFPTSSGGLNLNDSEEFHEKSALAYPNPVENIVTLQVDAGATGSYQLLVTDSKGNTVLSKQVNLRSGNNELNLDLSSLQSGVYTIRVSGRQGILTKQKILKQ